MEQTNAAEWLAVDFETASTRATPCAVGLALVSEGEITHRESWLISPPIFEFSPFNVAIHGITPEMCRIAPDWPTTLERVLEIADGRPLVAHNASFDLGVIRDACDVSGLPWPTLSYACTLVTSRRLWPDLGSHSLPFVAAHLGLPVDGHHDAGADALLAARIGILSLDGHETWFRLAEYLKVNLGRVTPDAWQGCHSRHSSVPVPTVPNEGVELDAAHPLFGKTVAFTGELAVRRRDAQQAVVDAGGIASKGVTKKTDFLVTGFQDLSKLATGETKSGKLRKGEKLRAEGQPIEVITENEFVSLLSGTPIEDEGGVKT